MYKGDDINNYKSIKNINLTKIYCCRLIISLFLYLWLYFDLKEYFKYLNHCLFFAIFI